MTDEERRALLAAFHHTYVTLDGQWDDGGFGVINADPWAEEKDPKRTATETETMGEPT